MIQKIWRANPLQIKDICAKVTDNRRPRRLFYSLDPGDVTERYYWGLLTGMGSVLGAYLRDVWIFIKQCPFCALGMQVFDHMDILWL